MYVGPDFVYEALSTCPISRANVLSHQYSLRVRTHSSSFFYAEVLPDKLWS